MHFCACMISTKQLLFHLHHVLFQDKREHIQIPPSIYAIGGMMSERLVESYNSIHFFTYGDV